ncbi:phosphotransferase [Roseovarius sp. SCSIO 43702]|nr:phosphotransferase [Roseovarius sp. SCSIO 43702]
MVAPERAAALLRALYGVDGTLHPLGAEKDANFRVERAERPPLLLKITNAAEARGVTEMQTNALLHLERVDPGLPVPRIVPSRGGRAIEEIEGAGGQLHVVRLMSFLEGRIMADAAPREAVFKRLGGFLARLNRALAGFSHPAADHRLQWDLRQAGTLRPMLEAVAEDGLRGRLMTLLDRFDHEIAPALGGLRAQVVHNDFNPHNILLDGTGTRPVGLIDFGDMVRTCLACDLAVALSYQLGEGPEPLRRVCGMIEGFAAQMPLERREIEQLPDLIRLRHATTLVIAGWRARRYPGNAAYILRNTGAARRGLGALDRVGTQAAIDAFARAAEARENTG